MRTYRTIKYIASLAFSTFAVFFSAGASALAGENIPAEAEQFYHRAMKEINPKYSSWVHQAAKSAYEAKLDPDKIISNAHVAYGSMNDMNIMGLAFLVMMDAAKTARAELKVIKEVVLAINKQKEQYRQMQQTLTKSKVSAATLDSIRSLTGSSEHMKSAEASKKEIEELRMQVKKKLDATNELGGKEASYLQQAMDRISALEKAISNTMKKITGSQNAIIQALKAS